MDPPPTNPQSPPTLPLLPSAEMAATAAAKAKEDYRILIKLKNKWETLTYLFEDDESLGAEEIAAMPEDIRDFVYAFYGLKAVYEETKDTRIERTVGLLSEEVRRNTFAGESNVSDATLEEVSKKLESMSKDFCSREKEIGHHLKIMHKSLDDVSNLVQNLRVKASSNLKISMDEKVRTCLIMLESAWSLENRQQALNDLMPLLCCWDTLTEGCLIHITKAAISLTPELGGPMHDDILSFLSKILQKGGISLWKKMYPPLLSLTSSATQARVACCVLTQLRYELEGHDGHLSVLIDSCPNILAALFRLMEKHFHSLERARRVGDPTWKDDIDILGYALKVVTAFAGFAPFEQLYKIIQGCRLLVTSKDLVDDVKILFKIISSRGHHGNLGKEYDELLAAVDEQLRL